VTFILQAENEIHLETTSTYDAPNLRTSDILKFSVPCLLVDNSSNTPTKRIYIYIYKYIYIYRVSQEERTKLREGVPYVKIYRYNPKYLYPKLNGYGDNGKRSLKL